MRLVVIAVLAATAGSGIAAGIVRSTQEAAEPVNNNRSQMPDNHSQMVLPKADRLPIVAFADRWDSPVMDGRKSTEILPTTELRPRADASAVSDVRTKHTTRTRDVCARHGLRRVATRHGRSWRCR